MTNLEKVIVSFDGNRESIFLKYIENSAKLTKQEKLLLNEIWQSASRFEIWNFKNINVGRQHAIKFLRKNYSLCAEANDVLTNAISYEWL